MKTVLFALVAGLSVFANVVHAQQRQDRRVALAITAGMSTIPDAFGVQCGRNGSGNGGGPEGSGALVVRPWRWLVLQGDLRVAKRIVPTGCDLVGFDVDTTYNATDRREPFAISTAQVGIETPVTMPLLRATAGMGVLFGSPMHPVTVFGVAAGTRGQNLRLLVTLERMQSRADATEVTGFPRQSATSRPIVVRPSWHAVRIGVEVPLR
jgi:hypothetical protein